jgi:hypothetical protein
MAAGLAAALGIVSGEPAASPEYRKDPAVRAAVERDLKTTDEAEIRRRWGELADLVDKPWIQVRDGYRGWVYPRWVVQGAVMELFVGFCPTSTKCEARVRQALLVHNPQASTEWSFSNAFRRPAFDVLWDNGWNHSLGLVHKEFVHLNGVLYSFHAESGQGMLNGTPYKAVPVAELAALTGYDFKSGPTQAAAAQPAPQAAAKPAAPPVERTKLRAGTLGVRHGILDPSKEALQLRFETVFAGGAAAKAGFQDKDVVQRIGEIENPTARDFWRTVRASPGKPLALVVRRNGQTVAGMVTPAEVTLAGPCFVLDMQDFDSALGSLEYEGECKDGFAHGRGAVSFAVQQPDGQAGTARYTGNFVDGIWEGHGTLVTQRWTYEGEFATMLRHGRGKMTYPDGKPAFEGTFQYGRPVGVKPFAEAVFVCTRPDAAGKFRCDAPDRTGLRGESPQALLAEVPQSCPSQRRLPSRTHLVWGCGFGATNAPATMDRGTGIEMRGRGSYQCLEREAACKRTQPVS